MRILTHVSAVAALILVLIGSPFIAPALHAAEVRNVFAGRENVLVQGVAGLSVGERVWFRVIRNGRTLASGTALCEKSGTVFLPVALPEMKPGVVLPLGIVLRRGSDQGPQLLAADKLWAFSEQPFASGHNPATPRSVWLYDPAKRTAAAFTSIGLPFETATQVKELDSVTNTVIVVGEAVSLEEERGLWEALTAAVARGNGVLLLAPANVIFKPPETWGCLSAGTAQAILRHPLAGGPAYALDLTACPSGPVGGARFHLIGLDGEAVLAVATDRGSEAVAWDDPATGGSFYACGLALIASWEETPAARWLLAEMLTHLGHSH